MATDASNTRLRLTPVSALFRALSRSIARDRTGGVSQRPPPPAGSKLGLTFRRRKPAPSGHTARAIKMTGMASYGAVHKDEEIWILVAFVQQLPRDDISCARNPGVKVGCDAVSA